MAIELVDAVEGAGEAAYLGFVKVNAVITKINLIEDAATVDQLASEVPIVDAGSIIIATEVEGALQEIKADIDGFDDELKSLTAHEIQQLQNLGDVTTIIAAQWGYVGGFDQALAQASTPKFAKLGIGTTTIPHGGVGYAMLALDGTNASANGPHVQWTTTSDNYPLLQLFSWEHDNIMLAFDAYYDGAHKSSDAGSSFNLRKYADLFRIQYDIAAVGGVITWNDGIVLDTSGKVFINDTANAKATGPSLTISGDETNGEYICLKDKTDVAHGMTTVSETDSFLAIIKQHVDNGGVSLRGFSADEIGVEIQGYYTNDDIGKATTAQGVILLDTLKADGTGTQNPGADANLVVIRRRSVTRFIFDQEGEMHSDDIIGVGDDWDEWDDLQLASDISRLPKAKFDEMVRYRGKDFEKAGLLTLSVDADGRQHAFIKNKAMHQFAMCCFAEVANKLRGYERAFEKLGISQKELLALTN